MVALNNKGFLSLVLVAFILKAINAEQSLEQDKKLIKSRGQKLLSLFQVVRFSRDICPGNTRNGTCYTMEECIQRNGVSQGSCASGFGVCCVFELSCGSTTNENSSYLVQTSSTSIESPCSYSICPCNSNICRIRYDFSTFVIAGPSMGTTRPTGGTARKDIGASIGSCMTDTLVISAPGADGSPIICGTNTGYHMILDSSGSTCQRVAFGIGPTSAVIRRWDIRVRQFECGNEDIGGPPGCLQYYTGSSGTLASFNFPPDATTTTATTTHLKNQFYEICIRREVGFCYICYVPSINGMVGISGTTQNSFGLSLSPVPNSPASAAGTDCTTDYIIIPNLVTEANAMITDVKISRGGHRYCGRIFDNVIGSQVVQSTLCTRSYPFRVGVNFDANEVAKVGAARTHDMNEQHEYPGGILGFKLNYVQVPC